jgi:hypothetical protein
MKPTEDKFLDYQTPPAPKRNPAIVVIAVAIVVSAAVGLASLLTPDGPDRLAILGTVGFWSLIISSTVAAGLFYGVQNKKFWT